MSYTTPSPQNLMGPNYVYADEIASPSELGIRRDGSFDGIMRSVGGINYYVDTIGFGNPTMIAKSQGLNQKPLGIRYFMKTGMQCSNGADMYEYIDTIPKGLPGRVGTEIQNTLGVKFQGLAPGIVEDATSALNPMPIMKSMMDGGYPRCKKVTLPVGDLNGNIRSRYDAKNVWIPDPVKMKNGQPHQTRWVFDRYITQDEWDKTKKTEPSGKIPITEGFVVNDESKIAAGVLFALLFLGLAYAKS